MPSCDPSELLGLASCFQCLPEGMLELIKLALWCRISNGITTPCDIATLLGEASCFQCLTPGERKLAKLALICSLNASTVTTVSTDTFETAAGPDVSEDLFRANSDTGGKCPTYPIPVSVSKTGTVTKVTMKDIHYGFVIPFVSGVDEGVVQILLEHDGKKVIVFNHQPTQTQFDLGSQVSVTWDDAASAAFPRTNTVNPGAITVLPCQDIPVVDLPAPAPPGPYATSLSEFIGTSMSGTWNVWLYVSATNTALNNTVWYFHAVDLTISSTENIIMPATCDLQDLLGQAQCFQCLPAGQQQLIELVLLCNIMTGGSTGGGSGGISSGVLDPTTAPTNPNIDNFYVNTANLPAPSLWFWAAGGAAWTQMT